MLGERLGPIFFQEALEDLSAVIGVANRFLFLHTLFNFSYIQFYILHIP